MTAQGGYTEVGVTAQGGYTEVGVTAQGKSAEVGLTGQEKYAKGGMPGTPPPLSWLYGTHQCSKNAKRRGCFGNTSQVIEHKKGWVFPQKIRVFQEKVGGDSSENVHRGGVTAKGEYAKVWVIARGRVYRGGDDHNQPILELLKIIHNSQTSKDNVQNG